MSVANNQERFESLHSGLRILSEIEERIDDDDARPQLERARTHLAMASRKIETQGFSRDFSKAIGVVSGIAVSHGYDDLAEELLRLGKDYQDE